MEPLDLDPARQRALAVTLEEAAGVLGALRHGSVRRFGAGRVVLNADSPFEGANLATGLDGDPALVEATLHALPELWESDGLGRPTVWASPSCLPELELVAEEAGYEARAERAVLLLTDPRRLAEGEPGRIIRPVPERDEGGVATVLARAYGWGAPMAAALQRPVGHRLDDPRHVALGAWEDGELVGVGTGFRHGALGQVAHVAVEPSARGQRLGRALASGVSSTLLAQGASLVWLTAEARGRGEAFWAALGFEPAYDGVVYDLPPD